MSTHPMTLARAHFHLALGVGVVLFVDASRQAIVADLAFLRLEEAGGFTEASIVFSTVHRRNWHLPRWSIIYERLEH